MSSIKQTFLQQVDNLMEDLCNTYPKSGDILLFREKYNLVRSGNSNLIIEYFIKYVYPLKAQIMEENEDFFIQGGGQEIIRSEHKLEFRNNIRALWINDMSPENKSVIWRYFKIYILLSEKYIIENMNL
jgi:hypothetical protein